MVPTVQELNECVRDRNCIISVPAVQGLNECVRNRNCIICGPCSTRVKWVC